MFHFYIYWKHQKTEGFLMLSEGIAVEHGWKWVKKAFKTYISLILKSSKSKFIGPEI